MSVSLITTKTLTSVLRHFEQAFCLTILSHSNVFDKYPVLINHLALQIARNRSYEIGLCLLLRTEYSQVP